MREELTGTLQECLIALLLYDTEYGPRIQSLVPLKIYDPPYRGWARKAATYWTLYGRPPGEHALDIRDELRAEDPKAADIVDGLFLSIEHCKGGINPEYVFSKVASFIRQQSLREGIMESVDLIESGKLDEAEAIIQKAMRGRLDLFHPGTILGNTDIFDLASDDVVAIPTGVKELDAKRIGPAVGELNLLIAPSNYGKSWWLIGLGKAAIMARRRVVHITLEMSERKTTTRYLQAFCGITKRKERNVSYRVLVENKLGQLTGVDIEEPDNVDALDEIIETRRVRERLQKKLAALRRRSPLVIRQFPTGALTVQQLIGYLDSLESQQKIVPDLLLIDYPDLMHLDGKQEYRLALGRVFQELRGIAVERRIAVAVVSQTNRQALGKNIITEKDVAEDYSKIATSDVAISYNQTEEERKLGLARLHVMKARDEAKGMTILLSQSYSTGQFCISSTRMNSVYWKALSGKTRKKKRLEL
ncbi:MAG: DnaB-like helicase C-terminal domain-containing protein [Opitutaceae bacterium]|jgi:hypothetical protein